MNLKTNQAFYNNTINLNRLQIDIYIPQIVMLIRYDWFSSDFVGPFKYIRMSNLMVIVAEKSRLFITIQIGYNHRFFNFS